MGLSSDAYFAVLREQRLVAEAIANLHRPPDAEAAAEEWGANCGPAALAAVAGCTLADVRPYLGEFRGHMNLTEMRAAMTLLALNPRRATAPVRAGCAHVMFDGPWSSVARAAYRHSHWIAYTVVDLDGEPRTFAYDVNLGDGGGWTGLREWEAAVLPELMPRSGTGYHVNAYLEVSP